jgi:hypothetical protein
MRQSLVDEAVAAMTAAAIPDATQREQLALAEQADDCEHYLRSIIDRAQARVPAGVSS